ncbi:MAG TPA: hypothetical protein VNU44_14545 [Bryobacteraceae bacterium]|nr:hypothetical protein [Bryobacteraceae bacterium]
MAAPFNSTKQLQDAVDFARAFPELTPVLKAGGYADQPARDIANRVMAAMLGGGFVDGRKVGPFPWKWNRIIPPAFLTNGWQQDYATAMSAQAANPALLGWLQDGILLDINNTAPRQPYWGLEVVRDLQLTYAQWGRPTQVCWYRNKDLQYGVWGGGVTAGVGAQNPGSGSVYVNPLGAASPPANPVQQLLDANGNFLLLTGYGTEGTTAPVALANSAPGTTATPGAGATTTWTVVDPNGQGFRLNPVPPQLARTYQVQLVGQARPVLFTTLSQLLDPIPDDFSMYFFDGFVVECYRRSPEKTIRAKFDDEFKLWMLALQEAMGKSDKERDAFGFYPDTGIMDTWPTTQTDAGWPFAPTGT